MGKTIVTSEQQIFPEITVLDVVSRYKATQTVFKYYDKQAGECICCRALFETLETVAQKYGLNLEKLMTDLETAAG